MAQKPFFSLTLNKTKNVVFNVSYSYQNDCYLINTEYNNQTNNRQFLTKCLTFSSILVIYLH